jgi:sporulation protein YlmC with PRC-barrel domain
VPVADIEGKDVRTAAGETIGEVERVAYDPSEEAVYLVVATGGFLGIAEREVAIPLAELEVIADVVILNAELTEDALEQMPAAADRELVDLPVEMVAQ